MTVTKEELQYYISIFEKEEPIYDTPWFASLLNDFVPLLEDGNLSADDLSDSKYIETILQNSKDDENCKKVLLRKSPELYIASAFSNVFIINKIATNKTSRELVTVDKDDLKELTDATQFLVHLTDKTLLLPPCSFSILSNRINAYSNQLLHDREVAKETQAKNNVVHSVFKESVDLAEVIERLKRMNRGTYRFAILFSALLLAFCAFSYPIHVGTDSFYFVIAAIIGGGLCTIIFYNCNKNEAMFNLRYFMNNNSVVISNNVTEKIVGQLQYNVKHNSTKTSFFIEPDCTTYYAVTGTKIDVLEKVPMVDWENSDEGKCK